jgi:hypothetical protein
MASEWGLAPSSPKIKMLRGAAHRERVVTREEESLYLASAGELMADVAIVLIDTGLRPEENFRLRWETLSWTNGQHGTLQVTHGKTPAARRMLHSVRASGRSWRSAGSALIVLEWDGCGGGD